MLISHVVALIVFLTYGAPRNGPIKLAGIIIVGREPSRDEKVR
jgi:hypothetical protein